LGLVGRSRHDQSAIPGFGDAGSGSFLRMLAGP
jgi:hypothetical protein